MKTKAIQRDISEWGKCEARKVFSFVRTHAFSREALINIPKVGGIQNVHYGDIHSTFFASNINLEKVQLPTIKDSLFTPKQEELLKDGDLIMADASEDYEGVGVTVSVHGVGGRKVVGGLHTFVLRDNSGKTDARYRQYIFCNPDVRKKMQKIANGVSVYGISKTEIGKLLLVLPPLLEQKRIVKVLEAWDQSVEVLRRKIELKKEIKKGLMQELLTCKTRLPGFSGEWEIKKFGELFSNRDERGTEDLPLLSITSNRGVIHQSASNKKDTSNSDKSRYLRICPGDIGYNTMRMWQGRSALSNMEGLVSPAYTILSPEKDVDSRYFAYLFKMPRIVYLFFQKSQGLVSDTLQCRYHDFSIVKYPVPEYKEQKAIAEVLTAADADIALLEKKLSLLEDQKKYLLNNLITGAIRTPESL